MQNGKYKNLHSILKNRFESEESLTVGPQRSYTIIFIIWKSVFYPYY